MINTQAVHEIKTYVTTSGGHHNDWYCGITSDIENRLFVDHNVSRRSFWIHKNLSSEDDARDTERYFLNLGFDGGGGGGDSSTTYIYVYKKVPGATKE